jgi:hypothetical protein
MAAFQYVEPHGLATDMVPNPEHHHLTGEPHPASAPHCR